MSIATRINEMSSHIEQAYNELQGLGADLTNVNKNIENISMILDNIYDSMPQVSGEGTSLTLDNTRVGKIKSTLKGNTSQSGTPTPDSPQEIQVVTGNNSIKVEGKNLFNNNVEVKNAYVSSNIGSVINYVNSTATVSYVNCCYLESGTTYTISYEKNTPASISQRSSAIVDTNNTVLEMIQLWNSNNTSITFTPTYSGYLVCVVDKNSTNIQIEKGSIARTYTPYTSASYPINLGVENF